MDKKEKENRKELSGLSKRFLQAMKIVGHNGSSLAREIDVVSAAILTHIRAGRNEPSTKIIIAFLEKFPFINARWLMTGEGQPKIEFADNNLAGVSYLEILYAIPVAEIIAFLLDNEQAKAFNKNAAYRLFLEVHAQKKLLEKMEGLETKMDQIFKVVQDK